MEKDINCQTYCQLANILAESEIDRYGRILIPKHVRDRLGLGEKTSMEVTIRGQEVVLRPINRDLEGEVQRLGDFLREKAPRAFVNRPKEEDSKWLSREYCLRKIGL
jgi:AbrB family looped-hinge helix DNA binding protein